MLRILLLLVLLPVATHAAGAQDDVARRIEALEARLATAEDHDRVQVLVDLMRESYGSDPAAVRSYGHEALAILRRRPDIELEADVLCFLGAALYYLNERDSAATLVERSRDIALRAAELRRQERVSTTRLTERAAESERFIGHMQHDRGAYQEAESSYRDARDRFELTGNRSRAAAVTNDLAVLYKTQGRYPEALAHHTWALGVFLELGDERSVADARHGLGVVYNLMGRSSEALEQFRQVLAYREQQGDREALATTLTNIGGVYEYQGDYDEALSHYLRAHEIYESLGLKRRLATALTNVAGAHLHLGHLEESKAAYERARELAMETDNDRLLAYIHEGMGRMHEQTNEPNLARAAFDAALAGFERLGDRRGIATALISVARLRRDEEGAEMVNRAVAIATEMQSHQLLRDGYGLLAELYERQGRFGDALSAYKRYKAAYDSLVNAESNMAMARLETEFQTKEQEQRIALLEQRREAQRLWLFGLLSGLGFLGAVSLLSFNRVRSRQRALAVLEQVHRAETERAHLAAEAADARARFLQAENERKAQELEAARRMQLSMLPKEVPDHPDAELITFMRTAAEVGGDYYDYHVSPDGALTVAIGDATGHGTQAGTMVAAVKSLFSDYAESPDLANVLQRAARALRRMGLPNVYMAFGLARLRGLHLELAGAGMPPALIYRAATGEVDSLSLKGMPLGAPADYPYTVQSTEVAPGDTLVLMSDGFPELRNPAGTEFGYAAAVDLVRRVGCCDVDYIVRTLDETIRDWRSDRAVFDDITVVVMRMKGGGGGFCDGVMV